MSKRYSFILIISCIIVIFSLTGCVKSINKKSGQLESNIKQTEFIGESSKQVEISKLNNQIEFTGESGNKVVISNNQIVLASQIFNDNLAHFYNTELGGKTIYFFVIKDKNGIYRAAANACQVCYDSRMGFRQEGDYMVCNTCGNRYPLTKIATEKGGCNPVPINPNLEVKAGQIIIDQIDLEQVNAFF